MVDALLTVAAVGLLGAGVSLGILLGPGRASGPVTGTDPSGFAEMYVATVLTQAGEGNEEVLVPYLGYAPDLAGVQPSSWYVPHAAAWSITAGAAGEWTVVVAANQLGLEDGGYVPAGPFFYEVDVEPAASGFRARTLPTMTTAPSHEVPAELGTVVADQDLHAAVTAYLSNLHGAGSRVPAQEVTVTEMAVVSTDGDRRVIVVRYTGRDEAGRATPLARQLTVTGTGPAVADFTIGPVNRESS